jgi:hypothetical protein
VVNTRSKSLRQRWHAHQREQAAYISDLLKRTGVDQVELSTDGPLVEPLTRLFDRRRRRM